CYLVQEITPIYTQVVHTRASVIYRASGRAQMPDMNAIGVFITTFAIEMPLEVRSDIIAKTRFYIVAVYFGQLVRIERSDSDFHIKLGHFPRHLHIVICLSRNFTLRNVIR